MITQMLLAATGIFMPIIKSLSAAAGSYPNDPSRTKMGAFLTHAQFQTGIHSSSLFLTASAQVGLGLGCGMEGGGSGHGKAGGAVVFWGPCMPHATHVEFPGPHARQAAHKEPPWRLPTKQARTPHRFPCRTCCA